jgi:hypothetical protein
MERTPVIGRPYVTHFPPCPHASVSHSPTPQAQCHCQSAKCQLLLCVMNPSSQGGELIWWTLVSSRSIPQVYKLWNCFSLTRTLFGGVDFESKWQYITSVRIIIKYYYYTNEWSPFDPLNLSEFEPLSSIIKNLASRTFKTIQINPQNINPTAVVSGLKSRRPFLVKNKSGRQ